MKSPSRHKTRLCGINQSALSGKPNPFATTSPSNHSPHVTAKPIHIAMSVNIRSQLDMMLSPMPRGLFLRFSVAAVGLGLNSGERVRGDIEVASVASVLSEL